MTSILFLGQYQSVRLLGEGGMGKVFLGRQLQPPRDVVIKVMHERIASQPRFHQNFEQEAAVLKRLHHPYIVQLLDAGVDRTAGPCLVLEYLQGVSLENFARGHRHFDPARVGRWLVQIGSALHAAHAAGIVHRDLKLENIMLLDANSPLERLKVMDFGLSQVASSPHFQLEKLSGSSRSIGGGTPDYLPPEQVRGDAVDHRGDLYSLGVMLFRLLTGKLPFHGEDAAEVMVAHAEQAPPRFASLMLTCGIPPAVEAVVQGCLAKYPNERPQSAQEVAEQFAKALELKLIEPDHFPVSGQVANALAPPVPAAPDAHSIAHCMEAWMPESIAIVKLRGFAEDNGGQVVESAPGLIRLRFRDAGAASSERSGLFSFFARRTVAELTSTMELHMQKKPSERQTLLAMTIVQRPEGDPLRAASSAWHDLAESRFRCLRSYLMGRG